MERPLAFIAVGAAVALAATVVVVGMASGGSDATGASGQLPTPVASVPAGHPTIASSNPKVNATVSENRSLRRIAQLERACANHPDNVGLLLKLGNACFRDHRLRRAERAFRRAVQLRPGNPTAHVRLAMVWHAAGKSNRAERAIKRIVAASPRHQEAHYSLAIVYFSEGRIDEAKNEWQIAARIDPSSSVGQHSRSFIGLLD